MDLQVLGPSGLSVSTLCLGTATFGNRQWGCDEAESAVILDCFLDAGGNFVDTANKYADGRSEEVLGRLLRGRRDRIVLGTKFTAAMDSDANSAGNSRKNLVRSLDASLRRLQTDYVDILWVHAWDGITPIAETTSRRACCSADSSISRHRRFARSCSPVLAPTIGITSGCRCMIQRSATVVDWQASSSATESTSPTMRWSRSDIAASSSLRRRRPADGRV